MGHSPYRTSISTPPHFGHSGISLRVWNFRPHSKHSTLIGAVLAIVVSPFAPLYNPSGWVCQGETEENPSPILPLAPHRHGVHRLPGMTLDPLLLCILAGAWIGADGWRAVWTLSLGIAGWLLGTWADRELRAWWARTHPTRS